MSLIRAVDTEPGQSRYAALAAAMRRRIVAGEWPPGGAIPAEQTLAAQHGVALGTMRRALDLLAEQGLVERQHGRGTFVRQGLSGAPMLRFFRFGAGDGEAPRSRILARESMALPAEVARALGSGPGEPALRLRRLRSMGGQPVLHEEIWLPLPLFAALADGDAAAWGDLLYPTYAERCGVHVHRAVDSIGFGRLGATQARALRLPAGHPCARVQRQAFDLAGRCVEWRTTLGDASAFHYTVSIT
ncbi:MAG: GntR family transcriptional regulator [Rubrivivax sp.]